MIIATMVVLKVSFSKLKLYLINVFVTHKIKKELFYFQTNSYYLNNKINSNVKMISKECFFKVY